jgi:hypothetical protein
VFIIVKPYYCPTDAPPLNRHRHIWDMAVSFALNIGAPGGNRTHNQQLRRIWVAVNNLSNRKNTSNMSNLSKDSIVSALLLSYQKYRCYHTISTTIVLLFIDIDNNANSRNENRWNNSF